jgi:hypothetical protein
MLIVILGFGRPQIVFFAQGNFGFLTLNKEIEYHTPSIIHQICVTAHIWLRHAFKSQINQPFKTHN